LASAIVLAGSAAPAPRPVIAWAHGTTGVARGCAPSLLDEPFAHAPAIDAALARGWVIVATDYVGQGTAGPHPYLIGDGEARPVLDAVRAARQLADAAVGDRVVVWGHSQGGHSALWTGISAADYAPELHVAGVAAMAPATDLPAMLAGVHDTPAGRIVSAYLLDAYSHIYPEVRAADLASGSRAMLARDIARHCMAGSSAWLAVVDALLAGGSLFDGAPATGAFGARLAANVPETPVPAPLWIAQGLDDTLVLPAVQDGYVARRCAAGQSIHYLHVTGRDHLSLVAPDSPLSGWLVQWTADRFAGIAAPTACLTETR
jgi:alpha-beta hydrolase superfamily lysophospholipase